METSPRGIKLELKRIIVEDLNVNSTIEEIQDEISLYEDGIGLDSIAIVNFIVRIERVFGINFNDSEISSRLFNNINSLAEFIESKIG